MARARNIKPAFFSNDILADIEPLGRLLFIGLWTIADREGRLEDRHRRIKAEVLPYDNCNVDQLLDDLQEHGFITRYEVDGVGYIQVNNFVKHQSPHVKETPSTIPAPDKVVPSTRQAQQGNNGKETHQDTSAKSENHEKNAQQVSAQNDSDQNSNDSLRANEINMQGKVVSSTVQAPDKHDERMPESPLLIPDSLKPIDISCGQKTAPPDDAKTKPTEKLKTQAKRFEQFWDTYPKTARRVAKNKCLETWARQKLDSIADDIIDHVRQMTSTEQWRTGYEPAPLTYLNQKRWLDGIPDERPKGSNLTACGMRKTFDDVDYTDGTFLREDGSRGF